MCMVETRDFQPFDSTTFRSSNNPVYAASCKSITSAASARPDGADRSRLKVLSSSLRISGSRKTWSDARQHRHNDNQEDDRQQILIDIGDQITQKIPRQGNANGPQQATREC